MTKAPDLTPPATPPAAIPPARVAILFMVMLVAAAGNTAMQSALPAIASKLKMPDVWVSLAFSWSALLWVITAPKWARMSDRRGRKQLMALGMVGFITSMGLCGTVLWFGLQGFIGAGVTFIFFALFRSLYGGFGSAAPPAVQAYVAARTEKEERTKALSMLASSFGVGTVLGPALAQYFLFEPFGLAGPLIAFALFGLATLTTLHWMLPNDMPRFEVKGQVTAYPSAAAPTQPEGDQKGIKTDSKRRAPPQVKLAWCDERIASWLLAGLVGGHAQAILLGVVGFLVRDRLGLHDLPLEAVRASGTVMLVGAMATLFAQWGLIPMLKMHPGQSVIWGSVLALAGVMLTGVGHDFYSISTGFALASVGFGLFRPGFTAGASLAVDKSEQGDVAGKIASVNGSAYILAPAVGVFLFSLWEPATFGLVGLALVALIIWGRKALKA